MKSSTTRLARLKTGEGPGWGAKTSAGQYQRYEIELMRELKGKTTIAENRVRLKLEELGAHNSVRRSSDRDREPRQIP